MSTLIEHHIDAQLAEMTAAMKNAYAFAAEITHEGDQYIHGRSREFSNAAVIATKTAEILQAYAKMRGLKQDINVRKGALEQEASVEDEMDDVERTHRLFTMDELNHMTPADVRREVPRRRAALAAKRAHDAAQAAEATADIALTEAGRVIAADAEEEAKA